VNVRHTWVACSLALMLSGAGALAQQPEKSMPGSEGRSAEQGMMGGGMGGMMGMRHCARMMGSGMMGSAMMPELPPGNERLQLQMRAEMMQKMGEILSKYAGQMKEDKRSAQ
jgi:hypothetical protein